MINHADGLATCVGLITTIVNVNYCKSRFGAACVPVDKLTILAALAFYPQPYSVYIINTKNKIVST